MSAPFIYGLPGQITTPNYSTASYDPLSQSVLTAAQELETEESQDDISQLNNQAMIEHLNTENSIRTAIQAAMHAIANQAESLSQQFIGDEIAQVKKGLENAGKAV